MGDLTPLTLLAPSPHMVIFVMLHKQIAFKESLGQEISSGSSPPNSPDSGSEESCIPVVDQARPDERFR